MIFYIVEKEIGHKFMVHALQLYCGWQKYPSQDGLTSSCELLDRQAVNIKTLYIGIFRKGLGWSDIYSGGSRNLKREFQLMF